MIIPSDEAQRVHCPHVTANAGHGKQLGSEAQTLVSTYEFILELGQTYAAVVWRIRIKENTAEAALKKMRILVLKGATRAARSTSTAVLQVLIGMGPS